MDNKTNQSKTNETKKETVEHKKWSLWLLIILAVLLVGLAGWLWWQLNMCHDDKQQLENDKKQLQTQVEKLQKQLKQSDNDNDDQTACNDTPTAAMKENIKAALDSKNTAAFVSYVSNPVKFVLAATEKGGNETPDEAAQSMEYTHTATGPWDFNLPQATLDDYDAGFYTDYFDDNTYVGRSASGMVVSFDFDCQGKISQIFVAADEDLL